MNIEKYCISLGLRVTSVAHYEHSGGVSSVKVAMPHGQEIRVSQSIDADRLRQLLNGYKIWGALPQSAGLEGRTNDTTGRLVATSAADYRELLRLTGLPTADYRVGSLARSCVLPRFLGRTFSVAENGSPVFSDAEIPCESAQ